MSEDKHWAGIDWGDKSHALCVADADGETVLAQRISHCAEGMNELVNKLRNYPHLEGVAIETSRHLLVDALLTAGITVYAVNPQVSKAWSKCYSASAPKSDERDAWTLAHGLRAHQHGLRPVQCDDEQMSELRMLCDHEQSLIEKRTACACELKSLLKLYYPTALTWFDIFTSSSACDFVIAFPTAHALATAKKAKLCGYFKTHRMALTKQRLDRIERRAQATDFAADPRKAELYALRATAVAQQLKVLITAIRAYEKRISALFQTQDQAHLFTSLPGAGAKLAPRLMAIFGDDKQRYESAQNVAELCGPAPVTMQSGNMCFVKFRRSCKKHYRNTLHQFAWTSLRYCSWAKAFYKACRARGQRHALALRNLARKWLNIIFRMWQDNEPYDDARYHHALKRANSPLSKSIEA